MHSPTSLLTRAVPKCACVWKGRLDGRLGELIPMEFDACNWSSDRLRATGCCYVWSTRRTRFSLLTSSALYRCWSVQLLRALSVCSFVLKESPGRSSRKLTPSATSSSAPRISRSISGLSECELNRRGRFSVDTDTRSRLHEVMDSISNA